MRHLQRWSTLLPAALVLAACSTFNPSPPPSRPVPPPPPVQPSSLALPVSIDKVSIQQLLEQQIPGSLADSSHVEVPVKLLVTTAHVGIDYDYHVSRGPIAFSTSGATLAAATALTGQIHAKARAGGFEGSVAMAAHVGVHGVLGVQPDYRLQASFSKDLTIDSAEMPVGFTVDGVHVGTSVSVRGLLENRLNPVLDEVVSRLDAKVAAIDIRTPLADAWQKIGQPVLVDRKDNAWLTITPLAVSFSGLSSDDTSIRATLGLQALVSGTIGQKPDPVNTGSLPNLSDPAPSSGFHFYFPVTTTYAELQDQVRKTVVGNTYTVAKNATVKVTDISLSGNGDAVTVALKFSAHVP
ncbi:MAG TPA: DUF4403 family protein, partial [Spirochaetia bacterium]|nr:DUF4403 family protein [Spirochaetia bacterium]